MSNTEGRQLQAKGLGSYAPIFITTIMFAFVPCAMQASCAGIFFPALAADYGVPTSSVTIYLTLGVLTMAAFGPFVGKFLAKYDVRIVSSVLVVGVAFCFFMMSIASSVYMIWVFGALLMGCSLSLLGLVNPTLINRWFKDKAGAILGLSAAFTGIGGVVFIAVGQMFIDGAGYRAGYLAYAIIILVTCLPCSLFAVRSHPEDRGMLPYVSKKSATDNASAATAAAKKNWSVDVNAAQKSPAFWLVCICGALANMAVLVAQFFPTYVNSLASAGVAVAVTGAVLAAIVSASQAVCKFLVGAASDWNPMKTIVLSSAFGVVAILMIWFGPSSFVMPAGGAVFGFFYASVAVLMPILGSAVFGTGENFSIVYGRSVTPTMILGSPAGILWPWISENFGGFGAVFFGAIIMVVLFAVCSYLAIKLGQKIPRAKTEQEAE